MSLNNRKNKNKNRNQKRDRQYIPGQMSPFAKMVIRSNPIPGDRVYYIVEEGETSLLTTTVTTGLIAMKQQFSIGDLDDFTTKYAATFSDYIIYCVQLEIVPIAVSTGVSIAFTSCDTSLTPDIDQAQSAYPKLIIPHTTAKESKYFLVYKPSGPEEVVWTATNSALPDMNMRMYLYTDATNLGAPTVATPLFMCKFKAFIAFRGKKS